MKKNLLCILILAGIAMGFPKISDCSVQKDPMSVMPPMNLPSSGGQASESESAPAIIMFNNHAIAVFRGKLFGYSPSARAEYTNQRLNRIISNNYKKEITTKELPEGTVVFIGEEPAFTITKDDLAPAFGEDKKTVIDRAIKSLTIIQKEVAESKDIKYLFLAAGYCIVATLVFVFILFIFNRIYGFLMRRFEAIEARFAEKIKIVGINIFQQIVPITRWIFRLASWIVVLVTTHLWLTFCLRQFPQTRTWGESLGGYLMGILNQFGAGFLAAIPDFFAIAIIILVFRILSQWLDSFFSNVETGRVGLSWLHPEVVRPTSRIARGVLWVFAFIMAYPYLPGSGTEAFKGVSVLVGVILSLGSTSVVNQAAAGMVLMYSRAFRAGDFIKFGDMEGLVLSLGVLSTKLRTASREEVTIPNAVLSNATLKNYSRFDGGTGAILATSITIGYSTPWRKVHELLLLAARKTPGLAKKPEPIVRQRSLSDFYVEYLFSAIVENPKARSTVLSNLHANIQDVFNESGEQIMSPHYVADPPEKVWVPKEKWFEAIAGLEGKDSESGKK